MEVCLYILLTAFVLQFYISSDWLKCKGGRERQVRVLGCENSGPMPGLICSMRPAALLVGGCCCSLSTLCCNRGEKWRVGKSAKVQKRCHCWRPGTSWDDVVGW